MRGGNLKKKLHSGKSGASESKELMLTLVWPKHTNIVFIFSLLFFRKKMETKHRQSCSLPFNVLTLNMCSNKNCFPRH
jgi:hypothetical protein